MRSQAVKSVVFLAFLAMAATAEAQRAPGTVAGVDLNLEGIVDPPPGAELIGVLDVRAAGRTRKLGVVRARSSVGEGMSLFRAGELLPENLSIAGPDNEVRKLSESPPGTRLHMLGQLHPRRLIVGSINVVEKEPERPEGAEGH